MIKDEKRKLKRVYLRRLNKIIKTRSKSLIENIEEAFADVLRPDDDNLINSSEHRAQCGECETLHDFFAGKTWQETLDKKSYGWLSQAQSFFSSLAWQYFLQAFLIHLVNQKQFYAEFHLLPSENPELFSWQEERILLLTSWKCDVIIEYLEIAEQLWQGIDEYKEKDILKALIYWKENYQKAVAKEQNFNK
jgi:hypothetical protein